MQLICTNGVSGAEKHLKHLLPGLKKFDIECDLMIICPLGFSPVLTEFANDLIDNGIKVTVVPVKKYISVQSLQIINRYLLDNEIEILHSHMLRSDLLGSLIKQFYFKNLFLISTKHGYQEKVIINYSPEKYTIPNNLYYYISKYTLKRINKNIAISKSLSELYINFELTTEYYPVIYNGWNIDLDKIEKTSYFKKATPQLIIVGRLEAYKGHTYVLKALPAVIQKYPDVQLILIGDGSCNKLLKEEVRQLNITDNVQFLGFQKDPYSFIYNSDIIIVPSLFESFGLVFIEAMGLKTPVVAFDVRAGNEILDQDTGCLVPKADIDALAKEILKLLDDPLEGNRIAENAFSVYKENYTTPIMIKNFADYYHRLEISLHAKKLV
ncbi:MAG: glycosyltransferase family 4 protein [Ferruginibacter sp.]